MVGERGGLCSIPLVSMKLGSIFGVLTVMNIQDMMLKYSRQIPMSTPAIPKFILDEPRLNPKMRLLKDWLLNGDDLDESHIKVLREDTLMVSPFGRQKVIITNRDFFYRVRLVHGKSEDGKMNLETVYESTLIALVVVNVWKLIKKS